jgi:hypothetical protein
MFEKFLAENAADFRQRYEGTYGFYRDETGKKLLAQLTLIRDNVCHFIDSRGIEYHLNADAPSDKGFEFIPPKASWYNIAGGQAFLVTRIAARQFQRGLSAKNTAIYVLQGGGLSNKRIDFTTLESIYLKARSKQDAYQSWNDSQSVAISDQIACNLKTGDVYVWEKKIGTFTKNGNAFEVKLQEPTLWRTEVTDALRALGCTTKVI